VRTVCCVERIDIDRWKTIERYVDGQLELVRGVEIELELELWSVAVRSVCYVERVDTD